MAVGGLLVLLLATLGVGFIAFLVFGVVKIVARLMDSKSDE